MSEALIPTLVAVRSPLVRVEASGRVDGLLLEMNLVQHYRNETQATIEIAYTFPLARDAVPLAIACRIGAREMRGCVTGKEQAASDYEDALADGDSAVLVSRAADGMLAASLGHLLPGETAEIRLRYGQWLRPEGGRVRIALPTVIAPRYGQPAESGLEAGATPDSDFRAEYPFSFTLELHGALAEARVSCATHRAEQWREAEALRLVVARAALDRDLVVVADDLPGGGVDFAALGRDGDSWVGLSSFVVPQAGQQALPLALKLVLDCSGSMQGDSIHQARQALGELLRQVGAADRISLTRFGSRVEHGQKDLLAVSGLVRHRLRQAIGAIEADLGGTEMEAALSAVYAIANPDRDAAVLLITDGEISATESLIAAACASGHRLFVVAVGAAPAASWLAKLAEQTDGAIEFVTPGEDILGAVGRLVSKLRAPRQKLFAVKWPGRVDQVGPVPAVAYEGETLHVCARLFERPEGEVLLEFATGTRSQRLPSTVAPTDTLARMAAAQRLRYETDSRARVALALAYQLLSDDTSWVLVLERATDEKGSALPQWQKVPQMLAAGWAGSGRVDLSAPGPVDARLDRPAMWRSRISAPVSRQEASSTDHSIVLPMFLRRVFAQQEDRAAPLALELKEAAISAFVTRVKHELRSAKRVELPRTLAELATLGLPASVCQRLDRLLAVAPSEQALVWIVIVVMGEQWHIDFECHASLVAAVDQAILKTETLDRLKEMVAEVLGRARDNGRVGYASAPGRC